MTRLSLQCSVYFLILLLNSVQCSSSFAFWTFLRAPTASELAAVEEFVDDLREELSKEEIATVVEPVKVKLVDLPERDIPRLEEDYESDEANEEIVEVNEEVKPTTLKLNTKTDKFDWTQLIKPGQDPLNILTDSSSPQAITSVDYYNLMEAFFRLAYENVFWNEEEFDMRRFYEEYELKERVKSDDDWLDGGSSASYSSSVSEPESINEDQYDLVNGVPEALIA